MDNTVGVEAAREEGGVALIWSAAARQNERERLVTGGDAALIALSWFHAHFREAAITAPT